MYEAGIGSQTTTLLLQLYRWFPSILQVLTIIRPETLILWHRLSLLSACPRFSTTETKLAALRTEDF